MLSIVYLIWARELGQILRMLDSNHQLVKDNELREPSDPASIYEQSVVAYRVRHSV
jgi:hypothetical protein